MSSLKTEILLVNQLTENDKKIEICSYSSIAFLHKVQSTEELSRKGIKDGSMDTIFCYHYAWTNSIWTNRWQLEAIAPTPNIENTEPDFIAQNIDGTVIISFNNNDRHIDSLKLIEGLNKIIINDKCTPFIVSLNIHTIDSLIKEALTDSPLLIIKENINCGNFLNNDRFNFPTDRINPLIDCPINKRLYEEILFHIFSQDEIYSSICMNRIILDFRNILNLTYFNRSHHDYSNTVATQQEHKSEQRKVCFINVF